MDNKCLVPEGATEGLDTISKYGHKEYVGGLWEEIGKLQFQFMIEQGLKKNDVLLDIACGCLRGGIHFINYLNPGNYLGLEKEEELVRSGILYELSEQVYHEKKPEFQINSDFIFSDFTKKPNFSIAQSLFTHLTLQDIELCIRNLKKFVPNQHTFFATFFERNNAPFNTDNYLNPAKSGAHLSFVYTQEELFELAKKYDIKATYITSFNHPRKQKMIKYEW